jgi:hypothetical protein
MIGIFNGVKEWFVDALVLGTVKMVGTAGV